MIGIALVGIATLLDELATTFGKLEVRRHVESVVTFGFLQLFWASAFLLLIALFREGSFVFTFVSLPTLLPRLVLEVIQAHVAVRAVTRASRSTFGFIRILTVPLLLGVDLFLGYLPSPWQFAGIVVIIATLVMLLQNHGIERRGSGLVLFSAINAVATISLYQYDVRHYNSVVAEQLIAHLVVIASFVLAAVVLRHEHPFRLLLRRDTFLQSFSVGVGGVLYSFAILFAPASIVLAVHRSTAVLWSVLAGRFTFHEHRLGVKATGVIALSVGLVLLAVGSV